MTVLNPNLNLRQIQIQIHAVSAHKQMLCCPDISPSSPLAHMREIFPGQRDSYSLLNNSRACTDTCTQTTLLSVSVHVHESVQEL